MGEEKLLTIREVSLMLGITEKEVIDLAENQVIPAYRIGGVYLRFKLQQVEEYKKKIDPEARKSRFLEGYSFKDRAVDFFYFYDFYIVSAIIIIAVVFILVKGY